MSEFPEEPLDSNDGYIPSKPDDILNDGRYTILRKLGWGSQSSTWLVADNKDPERILAAKIFTIRSTEDGSALHEKQFYEDLGEHHSEVPIHQGSFEHESLRGKHLVLLFIHIGPSVEDFRLQNTSGAYLPVHIVKIVIARVISILVDVHNWKMVHGAINAKNVLISSIWTADAIRSELRVNPTAPVVSFVEGNLQEPYPIVRSQPLDHGFHWDSPAVDFAGANIYLVGFGNVHQAKNDRDRAKDIYDVGLMTFHLLTGTPLLTNDAGRVEHLLTENGNVAPADISSTASFIDDCVKDLSDVPVAFDLLDNLWLEEGKLFS